MPIPIHQHLLDTLQREAQCLADLGGVLDAEHDGLKARDTDAIDAAAADKERLLGELETHGKARLRVLTEGGYTPDEDGLNACVEQGGEWVEPLRETWAIVREGLHECQEKNRVNGKVLEATLRQTREAMGLLLGQRQREPELYTPKGSTQAGIGGRSYSKA